MRYFTFASLLLVLIAQTLSAPQQQQQQKAQSDETFKLIILHNNDMHARFEQTNAVSSRCKEDDQENNRCYGGFARVAHEVREYRRRADAGEIPKVLYLNAGDTYTGTPWFALYKDNITATFLKLLKPDAISLGNHEFDEGTENLGKFLQQVDFPVLAANLNYDNEQALNVKVLKPSHVFEINGTKIGIIGYLTPETKEVAIPNQVEFIDEIVAINEEAARLKADNINIIIALGHSGIERDKQIAAECLDIDLVIGGHSHTFLYNGTPPDIEKPYDTYPITVTQRTGKKVPVVQSYAYTKYLGYLHLEFDSNGNMIEIDGTPILLNGSIPREADVLEALEIYRPGVLELQNKIVGSTRVHLEGFCRREECNLGNFIADSMVDWNTLRYSGTDGWTDAAIGIIQGGGVRASIEKNASGNITMEDVATVMPFESKVVVIEVTGKTLLDAFEHSVHRYHDGEPRGEFLQFSGVQIEYDMNKSPGKRVVDVKVLCAYCQVPQLENVDPLKKYRAVVQDFMANGGDGYEMLKNSQIKESETLDVEILNEFITKKSPIYPAVEWRITIKPFIDPSEEIVGSSRVYLDGNCYRSECNLGNFITDSFVDWYAFKYEAIGGWTDASIALIQASNIRNSFDPNTNNGKISRTDAMNILAMNQKIAVVEISGEVLRQALEHSVKRYSEGGQPPEFLQMSGLHVEFDMNKPIGSRVIAVKALCSKCTIPELEEIKTEQNYKILMPENLANGAEGFSMFAGRTLEVLNESELDAFLNYLQKKSPVYQAVEWRITIKDLLEPSEDIVGSTRVFLNADCSLGECNLGNFITDSMVDWHAQNYNGGSGWTDASIAVIQGSRIKESINHKAHNGSILRTDVQKIFQPTPYNLQTVTMKGTELLDLLEYSISTFTDGDRGNHEFLQLSGIQVVYDVNKASGFRIQDIKVLCAQCNVPELVALDRNHNYKIIMQSILAEDEYHKVITSNKVDDLQEMDINVFLQYLKKKSPVYQGVEWRITIIDKNNGATTPVTTPSSKTTTQGAANVKVPLLLIFISILLSSLWSKS